MADIFDAMAGTAAPDPDIADAILDERTAIVGTTGSGKTYTAKGFVERLLVKRVRICIVDPLGVWWGLRFSADRSKPGFDVMVFGGKFGDVEITEHMGVTIGLLVATRDMACIIDLSGLASAAARRRFMTAFAETVYEKNAEPLHLVLDEADLWCPQRPGPEQFTLLNRIDEIVRRGRVRGFIPWLISQRPAVINKDVLSQVTVLIAMRLTSSQDRNALGAWIEGQADKAQGKVILAALPRLLNGSGFVWAPMHKILEERKFPLITTFDSSRTPQRGEKVEEISALPPLDVSEVAGLLALGIEPGAAEKKAAVSSDLIEKARREGYAAGEAAAAGRILGLENCLKGMLDVMRQARGCLAPYTDLPDGGVATQEHGYLAGAKLYADNIPASSVPGPRTAKPTKVAKSGGAAEMRILRALAAYALADTPTPLTEIQWAIVAGMKRTGGTWGTYKSRLKTAGHIHQGEVFWYVTTAGKDAMGDVPPRPAKAELLEVWKANVGGGAARILDALAQAGNAGMTKPDLADAVSMAEGGGSFGTYLSRLRGPGLIETRDARIMLVGILR